MERPKIRIVADGPTLQSTRLWIGDQEISAGCVGVSLSVIEDEVTTATIKLVPSAVEFDGDVLHLLEVAYGKQEADDGR